MQFDPILPESRIRAMRAAGLWGDHLLTDSLDAAVAAQPGATAIVGRNSLTGERASLTYAELAARAERIALEDARALEVDGIIARRRIDPGER